MANTIYFGSSEMDDLKLGASQVDEIYFGATKVWPTSVSGAIITLTIDDVGVAAGDQSGTYTVPQDSSDGSGTGAQFDITVGYVGGKGRSFLDTATISSGNEGSDYASGEIVTLDMSSVGGSWSNPDIEVLTVTS